MTTCPITLEIPKQPFKTPCCKNIYEHIELKKWLALQGTCPSCRALLTKKALLQSLEKTCQIYLQHSLFYLNFFLPIFHHRGFAGKAQKIFGTRTVLLLRSASLIMLCLKAGSLLDQIKAQGEGMKILLLAGKTASFAIALQSFCLNFRK